MIDVDLLKANTDLLALAERDTQLRRVAGSEGGEWAGACPFCGGRDRFRNACRAGRAYVGRQNPFDQWQGDFSFS